MLQGTAYKNGEGPGKGYSSYPVLWFSLSLSEHPYLTCRTLGSLS